MTLTVVCVLKSGGIYDGRWVTKLKNQVEANTIRKIEFKCLSDVPLMNVDVIPLKYNFPGWWSKIELFRPNLFRTPVLYLDLDVLVLGSIDKLFRFDGFYMARDFIKSSNYNSSVMAWDGDYSHIFETFKEQDELIKHMYDKKMVNGLIGDQGYIQTVLSKELKRFEDGFIESYRIGNHRNVPPACSVLAFHGFPKMDKAGGWAQEMWDGL